MLKTITFKLKALFADKVDSQNDVITSEALQVAYQEFPTRHKVKPVVIPIQQQKLHENYPFIHYLKGRLISAYDPETGEKWVGHVAMYYRDSGRLKIDWDNGATTYHDIGKDSIWLFRLASKPKRFVDDTH